MHFHIVRHGQTSWNVQRRIQGQLESELDELGITQAIDRGKDFADMPLLAAYCSSSVRTRQTIAKLLGARTDQIVFMDELREVHFGIWQGQMWEDIEAAHPEMVEAFRKAQPHYYVEGAETPSQIQTRGVEAMETLIRQHDGADKNANILVVSHGDIMKKILGHYAGIPLTELHRLPQLPNCAHCIVEVSDTQRTVTQIAGEAIQRSPWRELL